MRNMKKLLAAMLALTMLVSVTGCSGSEKAASEPSAETKADVAETIGQKANDDMVITEVKEPHRTLQWEEGTDYGIELYNEGDLEIACMSLGLGDASNICRLVIRVNENAKDQILEWQDVRLWNESVPFTGENPKKPNIKSYLLKAGQFYLTDIYVDENALNGKSISDCDDIVIQAKYGDNSFEMAIPVAEVNARTNPEHENTQEPEKKILFVEEQEVYNENGIRVTIPEQNISGYVDFTIECNWEYGAGVDVSEVYVNKDLVSEREPHPTANMFEPNKPYEWSADLGENGHDLLIASAEDTNEITFNLVVAFLDEQSEEITITVPVITKTGD